LSHNYKKLLNDNEDRFPGLTLLALNLKSKNTFFYIHDSNQLPTFPRSKLTSLVLADRSLKISYEKKMIKLLPAPYETDCFDYSENIRSQSECINEILIGEYLQNKCLPKNDENVVYVIDNYNYSKFEHKFCQNNKFESRMRRIMSRKCRQACNQQFYEIWYSNENYAKNMLYLKNSNLQYIVFKSEPAMKFLQYLVSFGGLLGFWNRLSFLDLKNLILKFFKRIFSNECVKRNISKLLLLYKKIKKFLKIQVSQSKLFFRMPSKSPKVNEN
jgi:hypothetical protein